MKEVLQKLFEVRDQVHFIHLNTEMYAKHKALNDFYDSWLSLTDDFIETYQGINGRITGELCIEVNSKVDARDYLIETRKFIDKDIKALIKPEDVDLDNIRADMRGLINKTLYLLTLK